MGLIFFGRIAQAALALLALRILTSLLTPEEVGRWSLLLAVTSFFVLGLVNPVGMFINRRLHAWVEGGKIRRYMTYYAFYLIGVALLAALVLSLSSGLYEAVPDMPPVWVAGLVVCAIFFSTLNQTFIPSLNLLGYRGWFVLLTLGTVLVALAASVALVVWVEAEAELWQAGQLIGQAALAVVGALLFFSLANNHKISDSSSKELFISTAKIFAVLAFTWPLAISVLLTWIQSQSYRFIVQDFIGLELLGLFVIGYGISASLIGVFESVISTYFIPSFYKRTASENRSEQAKAWHEYASAMLASLLVTIAVIVSVSGELAHVLLDAQFAEAAQYIVWGALAEAARVVVGTYALIAHAGMDTKRLIIPNALAAIAAPYFVLLLVTEWSAHGVGMGLAITGLVALLSNHLLLSRSFEIIMPWRSLAQAAFYSFALILVAWVLHQLAGFSDNLLVALIWLVGMGLLLLMVLYLLLKSHINGEVV